MALAPEQLSLIETIVDQVFERLKTRVLGPQFGSKIIGFQFNPDFSLPGLFVAANREQANLRPDPELLNSLMSVAERHLDAAKSTAKAQVTRAVDAFLRANPKGELRTVLGGELSQVFKQTMTGVRRVIDTEASNARNAGTLNGITELASAMNIEDPAVYFVVVKDNLLCRECARLHLLPDGITPRVWRMSEIGHGYHRRGQENPKIGGLHPHCRCSLVTLLPGYGFDKDGRVHYIAPKHDELSAQR